MPAPAKVMGRVPGMLEETNQFYWDSDSIAATTTELILFQTPQSGSKSKLLTNMTQAGVLPVPKMLKVKAMRFVLAAKCTPADTKLILDGTYIEFWVNDKPVLDGPVFMFPQGCGASGWDLGGSVASVGSGQNGYVDSRSIFSFQHSIDIGVQTPFYVKVLVPTALSGLAATTRIWVVLEGELWRAVS